MYNQRTCSRTAPGYSPIYSSSGCLRFPATSAAEVGLFAVCPEDKELLSRKGGTRKCAVDIAVAGRCCGVDVGFAGVFTYSRHANATDVLTTCIATLCCNINPRFNHNAPGMRSKKYDKLDISCVPANTRLDKIIVMCTSGSYQDVWCA